MCGKCKTSLFWLSRYSRFLYSYIYDKIIKDRMKKLLYTLILTVWIWNSFYPGHRHTKKTSKKPIPYKTPKSTNKNFICDILSSSSTWKKKNQIETHSQTSKADSEIDPAVLLLFAGSSCFPPFLKDSLRKKSCCSRLCCQLSIFCCCNAEPEIGNI